MSETINIVDSEKTIKKRKPLRSELFIKELFEEKSLPSEHKFPVERVFSSGTDLIVPKRCSLKADTIRACMCLKHWWS